MKNQVTNFCDLTNTISNFSITYLTTLILLTGITSKVDAAVIKFNADTYAFSNTNTCTPQLPNTGGKCFIEEGVNVEAFSAQDIGTSSGFFSNTSHFHARNSYEAQHFSEADRLLGIYLTLVNGERFSLASLDYQLRNNERAISDFFTDDTKILISTEFDPINPVAGQFTEISLGNNINLPFQTLSFSEFNNITQVYIASSGDVNFDNITINTIPEANSLLGLFSLGIVGVLSRLKRKSKVN